MSGTDSLLLLVDAIGQGDEAAFRSLYEQTKSRVYNTALGYVRNRQDAEEITQDVYVAVFRSAEAFRGEATVTTWLYRIAVSKSLDFLKRQQRQKRLAFLTSLFNADTGEMLHDPPDFFHPGIALEQQENAALLFAAIARLPEKQRTAYILARVEGLSNPETADIMAVRVGAVESLLTRATENLRKELKHAYHP